MSIKDPTLTDLDHEDLDGFLKGVLEDYKQNIITQAQAVSGLAHVFAALDCDNYAEVKTWLREGRQLVRT